MPPLPRKIRLFNRLILILIAGFLIFQCGKCTFSKKNDNNAILEETPTIEEITARKNVSQEILPLKDSLIISEAEIENRAHIINQKDTVLASKINMLLKSYKPDNALFLMVDAKTNEILAWGERKNNIIQNAPSFLYRSSFPAASLIKTVTIAAAMESKKYSLHSEIPLIGRSHTLYKNQLKVPVNYSGPTISLSDSYAKSCNPSTALLGKSVGGNYLKKTGEKLGFNIRFPGNIPETSVFNPPDTGYGLAETASGFTRETTLSPLLAAAITRSILMQTPLEIPWSPHLPPGYAPKTSHPLTAPLLSDNTYYGLKTAMVQTVKTGTARKNISGKHITKRYLNRLVIGGKTGSLDGKDPPGRYDWFSGFAYDSQNPENAVIIVVMQIHELMRSQPATQVAALLTQYWAKENISF